jgi:hypothetical protein
MICGSRCLPHVPPRVLPKFVDPDDRLRMPVRGGDDRRAGAAHGPAPYRGQGWPLTSGDLEHCEPACGLTRRAARSCSLPRANKAVAHKGRRKAWLGIHCLNACRAPAGR